MSNCSEKRGSFSWSTGLGKADDFWEMKLPTHWRITYGMCQK